MAIAISSAGSLKPEIRLQQALNGFLDELDPAQRQEYLNDRDYFRKTKPAEHDVAVFVATLNRRTPRTPYGPRFLNVLQVVQQFAAMGDIIVGGSQNLIACGIWSAVRLSLELVVKAKSNLDKLSHMFMVAGRSAPRYEAMARLYTGKSSRLWSYYYEYFIVLVGICRRLVSVANKSSISRLFSTIDASDITGFQSDLSHWVSMMNEETTFLMARELEDQSTKMNSLMDFSVNEAERRRRRTKDRVLSACSTYDHQASWKRIRKKGNTELFLRDGAYMSWKEDVTSHINTPKTLIYTGKLGCGKSVLMANMVEDLQLHTQQSPFTVVSFFCQDNDVESLKARTIFGSIIRQLLQPLSDLSRAASILNTHPATELDDLLMILSRSFNDKVAAFCVIDGLDECSSAEQRLLIDKLRVLQTKFALRLCLSFRQEADNASRFDPSSYPNCETAIIPEDNPELEQFIRDELTRCIESERMVLGDPLLVIEIVDCLLENSRGMFLWVILQFSSLCAAKTDVEIRKALTDLPKDLAGTYARILDKCAPLGEEYQRRTLEFVLGALRPLTIDELREALSVLPGDTNWEPSRLPNDIYSILASCGAMLMLDEEDLSLGLVHQSAKDFLLSSFGGGGKTSLFTLSHANFVMAETVLTFLNYNIFDNQVSKLVNPMPQASVTPAAIVQSTSTAKVVKDLTLKILRSKKSLSSSPNLEINRLLADVRGAAKQATNDLAHPFHSYALAYWLQHICFGIETAPSLCRLLLRMLGRNIVDITKADQFGRTPLLQATMLGDVAVVKLLLGRGMKFEIKDLAGQTALSLAAQHGHTSIVELLIDHDADLDSVDHHLRRPLWLAASEGHNPVVQLLAQNGANLEGENCFRLPDRQAIPRAGDPSLKEAHARETALFAAARFGHEDVIRTLAEHGADLHARDHIGNIPLHAAIRGGHRRIFDLLLEKMKEQELPGTLHRNIRYYNASLLNCAVESHCVEIAEHLMDQVVSLELGYHNDETPLHIAARSGNETLVKMLINRGASMQSKNSHLLTPLWIALENANKAVVKILLAALIEDVAYASVRGLEGDTTLIQAIAYKTEQAVLTCINEGAAIDPAPFTDNSPLWWAVMLGDSDLTTLLVKTGALLETRSPDGYTPLLWAASFGQEAIVKILVVYGADIHARDQSFATPLCYSAWRGQIEAVRVLIHHGADQDAKFQYGTPLHIAASEGHEAVVKLLIENGANIEAKDSKGQTPLQIASAMGFHGIVKLLVERDAQRGQLGRFKDVVKRL